MKKKRKKNLIIIYNFFNYWIPYFFTKSCCMNLLYKYFLIKINK